MLNRVRSVMLMTLLGLILVSAGGYVGGQNGATMMFIIALILNFYSYCVKITISGVRILFVSSQRDKLTLLMLLQDN